MKNSGTEIVIRVTAFMNRSKKLFCRMAAMRPRKIDSGTETQAATPARNIVLARRARISGAMSR